MDAVCMKCVTILARKILLFVAIYTPEHRHLPATLPCL
jgi:hypothetical protein